MPKKKLKHNPKVEKPSDSKKNGDYRTETDLYREQRSHSRLYMLLVFIAIAATITTLLFVVITESGVRVSKYDNVRLDYRIYTYTDYENHKNPTIEEINVWVNACSRYDEACEGEGLIKGFYNNLLGMREGGIFGPKLLEKCIDPDWDGYNDLYNDEREALSFGNESDLLYRTDIIIWFKVHEINKTVPIELEVQHSVHSGKQTKNIIQIFDYI